MLYIIIAKVLHENEPKEAVWSDWMHLHTLFTRQISFSAEDL